MPAHTQLFYSFKNPNNAIIGVQCFTPQKSGYGWAQGEHYWLYSANGAKGTWHLNASKAWDDHDKLQETRKCISNGKT